MKERVNDQKIWKIIMNIVGGLGIIALIMMFLPAISFNDGDTTSYVASYILVFGGNASSTHILVPFNFNFVLLIFWLLPLVGSLLVFLVNDKRMYNFIVALIYFGSGLGILFTRNIALAMQGIDGANIAWSFGPIVSATILFLLAITLVVKAMFFTKKDN